MGSCSVDESWRPSQRATMANFFRFTDLTENRDSDRITGNPEGVLADPELRCHFRIADYSQNDRY